MMTRRKRPPEEFTGGKCDDCGNYSDYLLLDGDGLFKCNSCLVLNDFAEKQEISSQHLIQTKATRDRVNLEILDLAEITMTCEA